MKLLPSIVLMLWCVYQALAQQFPNDWTRLGPVNADQEYKWYISSRAHKSKMLYDRAVNFCAGDAGGTILVINSKEENDAVYYAFRNTTNEKFWLGYRSGKWRDSRDESSCYNKWDETQTTDANAPLAIFNFPNGTWRRTEEGHPLPGGGISLSEYNVICERPDSFDADECVDRCLNGGTCQYDANGSPRCNCLTGTTGSRCQQDNANDCSNNTCVNGRCIDGVRTYTCDCDKLPDGVTPAYKGETCDEDIDECEPTVVNNFCITQQGRCNNTMGGYDCTCLSGFVGAKCETIQVGCMSSPCQNGATCSDLADPATGSTTGFTCTCSAGLTGLLCDVDQCDVETCMNGGTCNYGAIESDERCSCSEGYEGRRCEDDVNECNTTTPCGELQCVNTPGSYTCVCDPGYTGPQCTIDIDECAANSNSCFGHGTCVNLQGSYNCTCDAGYEPSVWCAYTVEENGCDSVAVAAIGVSSFGVDTSDDTEPNPYLIAAFVTLLVVDGFLMWYARQMYRDRQAQVTQYGSQQPEYGSQQANYGSQQTDYGSQKTPYESQQTQYGSQYGSQQTEYETKETEV